MPRPRVEMRKVQVTVHPELFDVLEGLANQQGRTVAGLAAFALEDWVSERAPRIYPLAKALRKYENEYPEYQDEDE
jgi:hypothetical protein